MPLAVPATPMPKRNPGGDVRAGRPEPTCAEAVCLLLLERETGRMPRTQRRAVHYAVAGAVLVDLALANRIENGSRHRRPADPAPLGEDSLDLLLARIHAEPNRHGVAARVEQTAEHADEIRRAALDRLVARGVLAVEKNGGFAVLGARRYSVLDDADHDLRRRLAHVLSDDEVPTPRDVALIRLIDACGRFEQLVPPRELKRARQRITELRAEPLAGHAVASAVERSVAGLTPPAAPGIPVAGNAFSLAGDVRAYLTREYQRLGPVFRVRAFKRRITVLAGHEANMFLVKEGRNHLRSAEAWRDFAAELGAERAVMSMDGAEHDRMRNGMKRGYSRAAAEQHIPELVEIVRREIATWPTDRPITAHYALQRIATDELGILAAGTSPRDYLDDLIVFVRDLLLATVTRQRAPSLLKGRRFRRARARAEKLYQQVSASHDPARRRDAATPRTPRRDSPAAPGHTAGCRGARCRRRCAPAGAPAFLPTPPGPGRRAARWSPRRWRCGDRARRPAHRRPRRRSPPAGARASRHRGTAPRHTPSSVRPRPRAGRASRPDVP